MPDAMMSFVEEAVNESVPTTFPILDYATEALQLARQEMEAYTYLSVDEQRKYNYNFLCRAIEDAHKAIDAALGDEVLPALLGGKWRASPSFGVRMPSHSITPGELVVDAYSSMLSDPIEYRKLGRSGRPGNEHAICSRTPDAFDGGVVRPLMRHSAMGLVGQMRHPYQISPPLGVWAKRIFDASNQCWTEDALIIVANNLLPEHAAEFGFIPIAPAAH
jgi:hypothetical protein